MQAVIYVRVSSSDQLEGTSLESQEQACRDYAHRHNLDIAEVFIERGESAKFADRTKLLELLDYCKDRHHNVSVLLVWKLDRFARNVEDHYAVKAMLRRYGVSVTSVTEPIAADANGKLLETILAGFAAFDNDVRAMRSVQGMQQRIREGLFPWKPPLGYLPPKNGRKTEPDRPDPARFEPLRKAWEFYASGAYTKRAILRLLGSWGVTTARNAPLTPQFLDHMFHNPYYAGVLRDPWSGAEYAGRHTPLVSRELFARVQGVAARRNNSHPHHIPHQSFPVRGLVRCPTCEHPLTGALSQGRHRKYAYYSCYFRECLTRTRSYRSELVNAEFTTYLRALSISRRVFDQTLAHVREALTQERTALSEARLATAGLINSLEAELRELVTMRATKLISDDEFLKARSRIQHQEQQLRTKVSLRSDQWLTDTEAAVIAHSFEDMHRTWTQFPLDTRRGFEQMMFPSGYILGRIRTAELGLVFSVFGRFQGGLSNEVRPTVTDLNRLVEEFHAYLKLIRPVLALRTRGRKAA